MEKVKIKKNNLVLTLIIIILSFFPLFGQEKPIKTDSPGYHRRMGEVYFREKKYLEAENAYNKALSLTKNKADKSRLFEMLAHVYDKTKKSANYVLSLEKALNNESPGTPRYSLLTSRLIKTYLQAKQLDKAEKSAREAISKAARTEDKLALWEQVCKIHQQKKSLQTLLKECDVSKSPKPPLLKLLKAKKVYRIMGNQAKTNEFNKKIIKAYPHHTLARRELAETLLGDGKKQEALVHFEYLAKSLSHDRNRYAQYLVEEYLASGKDTEAKKWMNFLKRPNSRISMQLAKVLERAKKPGEALKELNQAIQNANSIYEACQARLEKAKMLERLNRKPNAIKECEIIESLPGRPDWAADQANKLKEKLKEVKKK